MRAPPPFGRRASVRVTPPEAPRPRVDGNQVSSYCTIDSNPKIPDFEALQERQHMTAEMLSVDIEKRFEIQALGRR